LPQIAKIGQKIPATKDASEHKFLVSKVAKKPETGRAGFSEPARVPG
jgi:hypothetical protein